MTIYSKFNSNRKECFQLITKIENRNGSFFSSKEACNQASQKFLNSIYDKYAYLKKNNFTFIPIKPQKINDFKISFEYQKLPTLEQLLFLSLQKRDEKEFISLIYLYLDLIKQNKIEKEILSSNFIKIFGTSGTENKMECLKIGCIDLNFDNIFYNTKTNKCKLIDYEWTFVNISIPYKYIFFRAISNFYINFFSYNPNDFFPLENIYKLIEITEREQKIFINFEYTFQCYVGGNEFKKSTKLSDYYNIYLRLKTKQKYYHFFDNFVQRGNEKTLIINNLKLENQNLTQQIADANQLIDKYKSDNQNLIQQIADINQLLDEYQLKNKKINRQILEVNTKIEINKANLNIITSSKYYKTWRLYCKMKDFIKK